MFKKLLLLLFLIIQFLLPQPQAEPMREVRAVWLTSVYNIDWPHSTSVSAINQQNRLREMLDILQETNINTVLFQVRPNADALYQSAYEPWSHWITGQRGQEPAYDPLALVIYEANKRGMEVHAWLNPYRYENIAGQYSGLPGDYSQTHPELIFLHNNKTYFDPGIPATTQLIKSIVADMITNYDLDGVVFDDYFYPSGMPLSADQATWDSFTTEELEELILPYYPTLTRGNFRRASVNRMIKEVNDTIKAINPNMVFGVSPAGIYSTQPSAAANWGTTLPPGITGADNYNTIFCDPLAWLHDGSVDYLSPQLYWKIGGPQDYLTLVEWWGKECERKGKHAYPSIGTYRLPAGKEMEPGNVWDQVVMFFQNLKDIIVHGKKGTDETRYSLTEIENQILANRNNEHNNVFGSIFFSTRDLTNRVPGLAPFLANGVFSEKAIFPQIDWLPGIQPGAPQIAEIGSIGEDPDAAAISIINSPATRYLLYAWEEMPTAKNLRSSDFSQVVFGKELALFYPGNNNFFAVAEFMPNREIGFMSEPASFEYITPVEIISPTGDVICDMFEFSWTAFDGSDSYQVMIARQQNPSVIEHTSPLLTNNHYHLASGLIAGQANYVFRVRTVSDESISYSAPSSFSTGYPLSTVLNAPADGAVNVSLQTTFQWNTIPEIMHYHLQVATGNTFSEENIVVDMEPITTNFINVGLDEPGTLHTARVRTVNECGYSTWSAANSFTTTVETAIESPEQTMLRGYPNPTSDTFTIDYPHFLSQRSISIYNHNGRLLKQLKRNDNTSSDSIDLSTLPAGLYMLHINTANKEQFVVKVVKSE